MTNITFKDKNIDGLSPTKENVVYNGSLRNCARLKLTLTLIIK